MPSKLFNDLKKGLPPDFQVLEANGGNKIKLDVDVGPMSLPYSVAFDGNVIMSGFTDRSESETLSVGVHSITWTFQHTEKEWTHRVRVRIGNKAFVVLEERSEAKKDNPASFGTAFVVANPAT